MSAEMKLVLSGKKKRDLTEWWLTHIHTSVEKFLSEKVSEYQTSFTLFLINVLFIKGYSKEAVPDNYTLRPPDSFPAVHSNLHLVQEIINPKEDKHHVQVRYSFLLVLIMELLINESFRHKDLMTRLKGEIYPRINAFENEVRCVLADAVCILGSG